MQPLAPFALSAISKNRWVTSTNWFNLSSPALNEMIDSVTVHDHLNNPTLNLLDLCLTGAWRLERENVRAIAGSCWFLAPFRQEVIDAVNTPVFASARAPPTID